MKKEAEGYFVIKFKNEEKYVSDNWGGYTNLIEDATPFETRANAYKRMHTYNLDKKCVIKEVKS